MAEKLLIDLSEIKVDEQDITPVEISENIICSQDLAQFVMTQAFAGLQKDKKETPPANKAHSSTIPPSNPFNREAVRGVLKPATVIHHKALVTQTIANPPANAAYAANAAIAAPSSLPNVGFKLNESETRH